ncbi:hypothetical protein JHN48_23945 [Streptomyces sp. MBT72]|nr:hypothetical protein [Streptomyces sp. MBT72]MBK3532596.1 hypothetical protein [Streptomyces sp. MBT72]
MLRHIPAKPGATSRADLHTDRIPPPVGTRGVLGTHRRGLRGAAGVALRG